MELGGYFQALAAGMNIIAQCTGTAADLVALGARNNHADDLIRLHRIYYGPTTNTQRQRHARTTTHDIPTLLRIEKHLTQLTHNDAWALREKLCHTPDHLIDTVAKQHTPTPTGPAAGVRITRRAHGNHTLTITDTSLAIADMLGILRATNTDLLTAAHTIFHGRAQGDDTAAGTTAAPPAVHTNVIITLDELDQVIDGTGDDLILRLTNGATMTGAEFVNRRMHERGYATLFQPMGMPLASYERSANLAQRIALSAEHPTCVWKNCNRPADECHIHHIQRFKDGGATALGNMVPLCAYHNGINDDDPTKPTGRGRVSRINGVVHWHPPYGGPPQPIISHLWEPAPDPPDPPTN